LWWNDNQHSEDQRNDQPYETLFHVPASAPEAQRKPGSGTSQEEKKLHPQGMADEDPPESELFAQNFVLDIEKFRGVEDSGSMEGNQQKYDQGTQPVDVVTPCWFG
jgi:hypothetical protein